LPRGPKNRFISTPDGELGINYLCAGYKAFFHHIDLPLQLMANLMKGGRPASDIMQLLPGVESQQAAMRADQFARAGRNHPCPCGSGTKFKKCHGAIRSLAT
jgi:uncharacterized protein